MNPLYQMMMNGAQPMRMNPMQQVLTAMNNPAAFVKNAFPDIPNEIQNDPAKIITYLQQTRGITDQQIQNVRNMIGR